MSIVKYLKLKKLLLVEDMKKFICLEDGLDENSDRIKW